MGINMIPNIEVNVLNITTPHTEYTNDIESLSNLLKENMAFYFHKGDNKDTIDTDYNLIYDLTYSLI
jgi:hypothetical protein